MEHWYNITQLVSSLIQCTSSQSLDSYSSDVQTHNTKRKILQSKKTGHSPSYRWFAKWLLITKSVLSRASLYQCFVMVRISWIYKSTMNRYMDCLWIYDQFSFLAVEYLSWFKHKFMINPWLTCTPCLDRLYMALERCVYLDELVRYIRFNSPKQPPPLKSVAGSVPTQVLKIKNCLQQHVAKSDLSMHIIYYDHSVHEFSVR